MAGLVLMSSACAYGMGAESEASRLDPIGVVHVNLTNRAGGPMEVYAAGAGTWYRIGVVNPGLNERFALRPGMLVNGAVELVARGDNGLVVRSGPNLLAPGDAVDFDLEPHVSTSTATVRPRSAAITLSDQAAK